MKKSKKSKKKNKSKLATNHVTFCGNVEIGQGTQVIFDKETVTFKGNLTLSAGTNVLNNAAVGQGIRVLLKDGHKIILE